MLSSYSGTLDSSKNFTFENYAEFTSDTLTRIGLNSEVNPAVHTLGTLGISNHTHGLDSFLETIQTGNNKESDSAQISQSSFHRADYSFGESRPALDSTHN